MQTTKPLDLRAFTAGRAMAWIGSWLLMLLVLAGPSVAQVMVGAQAPAWPARLAVRGATLVDYTGAPVFLRGFNIGSAQNLDPYIDADAGRISALGLNFVRVTPQWYADPAGACTSAVASPPAAGEYPTAADAYNPPASDGTGGTGTAANGWFSASQIARLDKQVASFGGRQIWIDLGITANSCDFYTNPIIQTRFQQMWRFLAARYKHTPYVAMYELMTEPNPPGNQFNNVPVLAMYEAAAAAIQTVDKVTPFEIGCAKNYNPRCLPQVNMYWRSNIVYAANWYEEESYVKQVKNGGAPYTGYPGLPNAYIDDRGNQPSVSCDYPNKGAAIPSMSQAWLAGMWDACAGSFSASRNVPVLVEQGGVRTLTPGAFQYMSDQLDTFNTRRTAGVVGWAIWVYRVAASTGIDDGTNGGNSGDLCMVCQSRIGWFLKNSKYRCAPQSWPDGSTSICNNWLDMIRAKGTH